MFPAEADRRERGRDEVRARHEIQADNGGTDYNAAFNTGRAANPGAQARIFLTDGGHNLGDYATRT